MTNTSTVINDAISAIVTAMRATSGYRSCWSAGTTGTEVPVYHSIEIAMQSEPTGSALVIGYPGDPSSPGEDARGDQGIATLGTLRHRQETAVIRCLALAQSGDADTTAVQNVWNTATAITDDVDTYLRSAGSLGLVPSYRDVTAYFSGITATRPYVSTGVVLEIDFQITVSARI